MRSRTFVALSVLVGAGAIVGPFLTPAPVAAHHAIQAEFDTKKTGEIKGVLKRFAMVNPHVRWYFEETKPDGTKANWEFTASGPGAMVEAGIARLFKVGDTYHVTFAPAHSGANVGRLRTMTFPDGRTVTMFHDDPTKVDIRVD